MDGPESMRSHNDKNPINKSDVIKVIEDIVNNIDMIISEITTEYAKFYIKRLGTTITCEINGFIFDKKVTKKLDKELFDIIIIKGKYSLGSLLARYNCDLIEYTSILKYYRSIAANVVVMSYYDFNKYDKKLKELLSFEIEVIKTNIESQFTSPVDLVVHSELMPPL